MTWSALMLELKDVCPESELHNIPNNEKQKILMDKI
jgi:hypothetical protein|tara:strand:- start:103 stop:210 length:108 start_codon:yes stop_codon:yes gene_type:complete